MLNLKSNGERLKTNRITFVLFFLVAFKISDLKLTKHLMKGYLTDFAVIYMS